MGMLGELSDGGDAESASRQLRAALAQMADSTAVAWAPKFGAALAAVEDSCPQARTVINVICLDMWEHHTHRSVPLDSPSRP